MTRRLTFVSLAVALVIPAAAHAAFPGANGKMAFVRGGDIWTMNPDGTGKIDITNSSDNESEPAWSPEGTRILFWRSGASGGDIWVMNADGSNQAKVIPSDSGGHVAQPAWSPDGTQLAYTYFVASDFEPIEDDVYTASMDGSGKGVFMYGNHGAGWSPDGKRIAGTCCNTSAGGTSDIDWRNTGGLNDGQSVTNTGVDSFLDWSPDATLILGRTSGSLFTIKPDGTARTTVPNSTSWFSARWSPDGTKFVYLTSDFNEIAVANTDGTGATQLTHEGPASPSRQPAWQPTPLSYARPKGASPLQVFLVPAHTACAPPGNRTHGSPLAFPSCAPPSQTSGTLTVGTPDANGQAAKSVAKVVYGARAGDLDITATVSDVRKRSDLSDYAGELQVVADLRITDKYNTPNPGGPGPGTVTDTTNRVRIACVPTSDTTVGSDCNVTTTVNALTPGSLAAGRRSIWQLEHVRAYDGGPDGDADTPGDNTLFMDEGLFIP